MQFLRLGRILLPLLVLAACAELPAAGPTAREITSNGEARQDYVVVDVTPAVLPFLDERHQQSFSGTFGGWSGGGTDVVGVGDTLKVNIWEAAAGGLFSDEAGRAGGSSKSTVIPEQVVSRSGTISIPYAGMIQAAGRTPDQIKESIEAALAGKAIEPQVLVQVVRRIYAAVTVTGRVGRSGRIPLNAPGDRILDVIAAAGGEQAPTHEVFVQLARGKRTVKVPLETVIDHPAENILVRPGDTLTLLHEPRRYTVFGATGRNFQGAFMSSGTKLTEALANAGGLIDERADPKGIFVYRKEDRTFLAQFVPQERLPKGPWREIPVIYQIDLRDPAGLFRAQSFEVVNGDTIYVATAAANELQKFLILLNLGLSSGKNVSDISARF